MRISDWSSDVCSSDLLVGERQRQQVVELAAAVAAGAQVLAVDRDVVRVEEASQPVQEGLVEFGRPAQGQRQAVAGQRVARGEFGERFAKRAADADPVLRRGFEEVERARRRGLQRSEEHTSDLQSLMRTS